MQNLKKNRLVVSKMTGIWWILTRALESLQNLHFKWAPSDQRYIMFEPKKYRRVIFHDTEEWCKIWRKTDLWFGKWYEEFGKFSLEHWKVSKLGLSRDYFVQNRKCMSLKFREELCVMTMKNDTKIEEEWTCPFKTDMRNFTNLTRAFENLKNLLFDRLP